MTMIYVVDIEQKQYKENRRSIARQTVQTRGRLQKDAITPCFCLLETFRLDVEESEGQSVLLGGSGLGFVQTNCL